MFSGLSLFKKTGRWLGIGLFIGFCFLVKPPTGLAQEIMAEEVNEEDRQVTALISKLKDPDPNVRLKAADILGNIGSEAAINPLIEALQDPVPLVRRNVVSALGKIGSEAAVIHLITVLEDSDSWVRSNAASVLGQIGSEVAIDPLIILLQDQSPMVRSRATAALVRIGEAAVTPLISSLKHADPSVRIGSAYALGKFGENGLEVVIYPLITALQDPDPSVRTSIIEALEGIRSNEIVAPLITAIQNPDPRVRQAAIQALSKHTTLLSELFITTQQDESSDIRENLIILLFEFLIVALQDSNSGVRSSSAETLGEISSLILVYSQYLTIKESRIEVLEPVGIQPIHTQYQYFAESLRSLIYSLIIALQDSEAEVRQSAAKALGQVLPRTLSNLLADAIFQSTNPQVRENDTNSIVEVMVHPLRIALQDSSPEVRSNAIFTIGEIGSFLLFVNSFYDDILSQDPQYESFRIPWEIANEILLDALIRSLASALQDPDPGIRSNILIALGRIGSPTATTYIINNFQDLNPRVRRSAAHALGEIGSEVAVSSLINALQDSDSNVRWIAVEALGKTGSVTAVNSLINALQDSDSGVRWRAAEALGQIGSVTAANSLINALQDSDSIVRWKAEEALERLGKEAVSSLISALQNPSLEIRRNAADLLGAIGSPAAIDPLIATLQDSGLGVRRSAASALGKLGEPAIPPLIQTLQDPNPSVRGSAASALGSIGSEMAIYPLIEALQDVDLGVRRNAASALGSIGSPMFPIERLQDPDSRVGESDVPALGSINSDISVGNIISALISAMQESEDYLFREHVIRVLQRYQTPSTTDAFINRLDASTETPINRYRAINSLTRQYHLQNLSNSTDLLQVLSDIALRKEDDLVVRYGAFLLLSAVNTSEAISLLDAHESDFLALVEANYTTNLPYYLPEPLNSDQIESPNPFEEPTIIAALDPYSSPPNSLPLDTLQEPIIPSIPQGANPGETKEEVTTRLAGRPAVCRFPWVTKNWSRCRS